MTERSVISIALCCYNSAARIKPTLEALAQLEPPRRDVELLLIDNCSTDDTATVSQSHWESLGCDWPLRILSASPSGLSHARTKAIQEARGDLIIFCDDDNLFSRRYLIEAEAIMDAKPGVGCLGGQAYPVFPANLAEIPSWFYTYAGYFAIGSQHYEAADLTSRAYVWGAGMVARLHPLQVLLANGLAFAVSDRSAGSLESGGDTELALWMILSGYRLWYSPDLLFGHCIPEHRLSLSYVKRLDEGFERAKKTTTLYEKYLKRIELAQAHSWLRRHSIDAIGLRRFLRSMPAEIRHNCLTITRLRPELAPHLPDPASVVVSAHQSAASPRSCRSASCA